MALMLFAATFILFFIWIWKTLIRRQVPDIPSPKALPIVGHLMQLGRDPKRPYLQMYEWAQECGHVYAVRMFSKEVVFINSYEALYETLVEKGRDYAGRPRTLRACILFGDSERETFDIAMRTPDEYWTRMRRLATKSLKYHGEESNRLEEIVLHYADELISRMAAHGDQAFDAREEVYDVFTAMMYTLVFGVVLEEGSEEMTACKQLENILNKALSPDGVSVLLDEMPWLRHFGHPAYRTALEAKQLRDALYTRFINQLKESDDGQERGLYESIHNAQLQIDQNADGIDEKINCILTNITVAGLCTTANTMSCILTLLVIHQDVQTRMREEISEVLGYRPAACLRDKESLPYTRAVIMEVLRLFCVAPITLPHMTITDTTVCGYRVPKGTTVMMNVWAALHSEKDWKNPMQFDPQRFLDEDGKLLPPEHKNRRRLINYGAGARQCLGEQLANSRLLVYTTAVLQRYVLCPDPDHPPDFDPRRCEMNTIIVAPPCRMIARPRS